MSSEDIDLIRSRINLVDLISQQVILKKIGRSWKGLCPFHQDKHPSFDVSSVLGRYRCWSCGAKGDAFSWVMQTQNVDFKEALHFLAKEAKVELRSSENLEAKSARIKFLEIMECGLLFFSESLLKSVLAKKYCEKRYLSSEIIKKWELGYGPDDRTSLAFHLKSSGVSLEEARRIFLVEKDSSGGFYDRFINRLIFPIRNEKGELVGFGGRSIGNIQPKYINSSDSPLFSKRHVLYGLHQAKKRIAKENKAILVEGYMDVIACHEAGLTHAIASLGTSFSSEHARMLRRWCEEVIILYDGDAAGQLAAERATEILKHEGFKVNIILLPEGQDPDTLLHEIGPHAILSVVQKGMSALKFKIMRLEKKYGLQSDHFWNEVTLLLADTQDPFEREQHILELAGKHPNLNDIVASERALRQSIQAKTKKKSEIVERKKIVYSKKDLYSVEKIIFHALSHPDDLVRKAAWNVCVHQQLFYTQKAQKIASEIKRIFVEKPPTSNVQQWLLDIEEEVQYILTDLFFENIDSINKDVIEEASLKLKLFEEKNRIKNLFKNKIEDSSLNEIHQKMKEWKN